MYGLIEPYFQHLERVAHYFLSGKYPLIALAWLHDTVEDTKVELPEIYDRFGSRIAKGVDAMTRRDGEPYLDEYLDRVLANIDARQVKIIDLTDNLSNCWDIFGNPRFIHRDRPKRYSVAIQKLLRGY